MVKLTDYELAFLVSGFLNGVIEVGGIEDHEIEENPYFENLVDKVEEVLTPDDMNRENALKLTHSVLFKLQKLHESGWNNA